MGLKKESIHARVYMDSNRSLVIDWFKLIAYACLSSSATLAITLSINP